MVKYEVFQAGSSMVEHQAYILMVTGSIPVRPTLTGNREVLFGDEGLEFFEGGGRGGFFVNYF